MNSKAYHDQFESLDLPKDVRESLYKWTGEILNDTDGTPFERMMAIDICTGEHVADTMKYKPRKFEVTFNSEDQEKIFSIKVLLLFFITTQAAHIHRWLMFFRL
ncbi:hypothetical protein HMPREF9069_01061 [Atopobium sp. oral taxon 810 str. F0209]|nr:hypothetical protein HMPREF9069_01061 [Atopobium sp. oral taxon 810 str. F0209]